jgi:putative inorganic carbon (HCO3(-)) transporter
MTFKLYLLLIALTYLRPFDLFAPELAFLRPMLVLMLLVLFLSILDVRKRDGGTLSPQHRKLMWGIIAMVFVSVTLVAGFGDGIGAVIAFLPSPLLFFISGMNLTSLARVKATVAVILASLVVLCGMSIACYHDGYMIDRLIMKENGSGPESGEAANVEPSDIPAQDKSGRYLWRVRSVGFLGDPNDFAQTMICFLPMLFAFWRPKNLMRNFLIILPTASVLLYTIYLTRSRGALLGIAALFFLNVKNRLGTIKTAALVVGMFSAAMALNFTGGRAVSAKDDSAGGRIEAWAAGLRMLTQHPLTGVGYHRFGEHHSHTAHNTLVVSFGEMGILGYWVWLGLLVVVITQITRSASTALPQTEEQLWATRMRTAFFGFFTCSMFLSRAFEPPLFILLVLCIGVWHAVCEQRKGTPEGAALAAPLLWRARTLKLALLTIAGFYILVNVQNVLLGR